MDDFERRLASRLSAYERSVSVPDPLSANPAPHRRAWAAVAVVVVLAVGIGLVGSRLLSGVRPVGNGPVTSLTWTTRPFVEGARVVDLRAIGTRLIATGGMATADGSSPDEPTAWYSDDGGVTWAASSVEDHSGGPAGAQHWLARVVEHDGRLLALDAYTFGQASDLSSGGSTQADVSTALWSSDDHGTSWTLATPVPGSVSAIAAGPERIIALGTGEGGVAVGWQSSDGTSWQPLPLGGMATEAHVADVAYDGDAFVAVGSVSVQDGDTPDARAPAAWRSADGQTWSVAQLAPMGTASAVYADGSSVIAVGGVSAGGQELSGTAVIWRWSGGAWTAQRLPSSPSAPAAATGIAANDMGSLARVQTGGGRGVQIAQELWFTPTAEEAVPTEQGLGIQVSAMAALRDRFVVISNCGKTLSPCSPSVSIGKPVSAPAPSNSSPVASPRAVASATPSTATTVSPSATPAAAWIATPIGQAGDITAMVESGPTLTAFGWGDDAIWTSTDGTTWVPDGPVASPDDWDGIGKRTAVWLDSLYVVGGSGGVDQTVPLILTSSDRTHWEAAAIPDAPFCGRINHIVKHGSQLVALGIDCTSEPGRGLILTSRGGVAWTTVEVGFADLDGAELMGGVAIGDELVAVGGVQQPDGTTVGGVWGSAAAKGEGITSLGAGGVWSVTERGGLVVAVGESSANGTSSPAVWTSQGAGFSEWTQVELPDCDQCTGALTSVVATDDGFFAFGGIGPPGTARNEPIVYRSADGVSWQRQYIAGINRGSIAGVIATRFGPIAFGSAEAADQTQVPVVVTLNH